MEKYAQIPGLLDAKSAREMDLIGSLSASEKARAELQATETVISQVQGLEEAKKRSRDLDAFLSANPLAGKTALDAATLVLAQSSLVAEGSANAELNSFAFAAGTRGQLASVKSTIVSLNADLAQAISQNKSANEKEDIRAKIARAEEEAFKLIDSLFAQIQGEETMRREMVKQALDPAGVASAQATILAKSVADARLSYGGESGDLSVVAVERLRTYLTGMRGREYSDLLTDLAGKISAPSSKTFDGYSGSASAVYTGLTSQEKDQAAWRFVRDFVMTNRSAFEKINSAPDSNDPRSVNRKWDDLFQSLSGLSDQASAKDDFASQIPSSNSSAWVVSYTASRQGLLARLAAVLSSGNITASYAAMSGADREVLSAYGSADSLMDARQLSRNLEQIRSTISVEIASLPASYESVFRREKQKEYSNQLTASSLTLDGLRRDQSAVQTELYALYSENLTATGSRKTDIENRISELELKANDLNARLEPLQAQARHTAALLREASQSGSSMVPGATGSFYRDAVRIGMADYASRVFAQSRAQTPAAAATSMELVKGALGMVQTDASGTILRDNSGKPMVTAEFAALGVAADADLSRVFSGSMKGAELVRYAQRLDAYLKSGRTISPEVSTAISQMQSSLRDVAAAKLFIEQRDQTGTDLLANANAMQAHARALSEKYPQFVALETQISSALSGSSPVSAVLAVMEKEENVRLLYLFEGYNES
ncbi:MAG TPA: hypothetical protein PLW55_10890, partial [Leptospiraceae bacterium]|nr:hypothetical protein [Leptospiraceae bacterium]